MKFQVDWYNLQQFLLALLVFDVLAYQARYQINDIRGIDEDKEAGHKNRLLSDDVSNPEQVVRYSLVIAIFKIILAVILTFLFGNEIKILLVCSLFYQQFCMKAQKR